MEPDHDTAEDAKKLTPEQRRRVLDEMERLIAEGVVTPETPAPREYGRTPKKPKTPRG